MQNIVFDKPYIFVPPSRGTVWPALLRLCVPRILKRSYGVEAVRIEGLERLRQSLAAGHGVILAPNHCRDCDPLLISELAGQAGTPLFVMASAHLFMEGRLLPWLLPRAGAFSVYREGMDRAAVACAVDILVRAERPLLLFPEGVISRTNDRLNALMEGAALIARSAARKRAKASPAGRVVVHPVAIRYKMLGEPAPLLEPVLASLEARLSWRPQAGLGLVERILKLGHGLLCLKEIEFFGHEQPGTVRERIDRLIDHLLVGLEAQWVAGRREGGVVARVKRLRAAILPDMVKGDVSEEDRQRRWLQLADLYLAQQLDHYPQAYLAGTPSPERLLETVERYEEDLCDALPPRAPLSASVIVGEAIAVDADSEGGDLMEAVRASLEALLGISP